MRKKFVMIIGVVTMCSLLCITGCGDEDKNSKKNDNLNKFNNEEFQNYSENYETYEDNNPIRDNIEQFEEESYSRMETDRCNASEIKNQICNAISECSFEEPPVEIPNVNNIAVNELFDSSVTGKFAEYASAVLYGANLECKQEGYEFIVSIEGDYKTGFNVKCEAVNKK